MARKPVSVFKRPMSRKGQFRYYIQVWNPGRGGYSVARSAQAVASELGLDEQFFPSTSRTGALLIGQELLKKGGILPKPSDPLFADYCAEFWDWKTSTYIHGKLARGKRIGKEYVQHNAGYIKNHVRPAFPVLKLVSVRPFMLEAFVLDLKESSGLSNRSINAVIDAIRKPLKEATKRGVISSNPASELEKLPDNTKEKGIPEDNEILALLSLPDIDPRVRCAIKLSVTCALRLGEILALKLEKIMEDTLRISSSWSKVVGMKDTKTGKIRIVPLPAIVKDDMLILAAQNPHGPDGFLMFGTKENAPLDCRALERGFDKALIRLSLGDKYAKSTKKEKKEALKVWRARRITFHSLRHYANTRLRGAVPDETLRKLTGHASEAMTNHYDHITKADISALAAAQKERILPFIKCA